MNASTALAVCALALPQFARGAEPLADKLRPLIEAHRGQVSVAIKHLKSGESFVHEADVPRPTASLIKLPVLVAAYRQAAAGKADLQQLITLRNEDKVPGSGILTNHFSAGAQLPLRDYLRLMTAYSDNTATNLVLEKVGLAQVNEQMESLGLPNTKIHSQVFRRETSILPERSKQFGLGSTTANEMVSLLEKLWNRELADEETTIAMLAHLRACEDKRLNRLLPAKVVTYQKTGSVNAVRTVAGILEFSSGPVAICVLTCENEDERWIAENEGEVLSAKIGQAVYEDAQIREEK